MIPGDEGKPMSLLEFISDEPVDCEPFLEYAIHDLKGRSAEFASYVAPDWMAVPSAPDRPSLRDCMLAELDHATFMFEAALQKLRRERTREKVSPAK